jgi:hypothetical protein
MNLSKSPSVPSTSLRPSAFEAAGRYLGGRGGLIALAALALLLGAVLGWSWLVAIGVAPLLLGLLSCAAMCALGLCMNRMVGRSGPGQKAAGESSGAAAAPSDASRDSSADDMTNPPANAPQS